MGKGFAEGYIDVAQRIAIFRDKYPEGSLQPVDASEPVRIIQLGERTYLQYVAAAYRHPQDEKPGIGVAWEAYPGRTPFTKDSEAMVAETSAWGRAIVAALAADTKAGIASAEEVQAAKSRQQADDTYQGKWDAEHESTFDATLVEHGQPATDKQVQQIAILRKNLPFSDEEYRERLQEHYNVTSAKDLTKVQAMRLIEQLKRATGDAA